MVGQWFAVVSQYTLEIFSALAALDLAVFGWDLWRNYHGDLRQALLSTTNKILILGFFLALLMNGQTWMSDIINLFVTIGKQASGVPSLSPSTLLLQGFQIFGTLLGQATKSGLMLGLGETTEELLDTFADLRAVRCDTLTLGQYLAPTLKHVPVARFWKRPDS